MPPNAGIGRLGGGPGLLGRGEVVQLSRQAALDVVQLLDGQRLGVHVEQTRSTISYCLVKVPTGPQHAEQTPFGLLLGGHHALLCVTTPTDFAPVFAVYSC